MKFVTIYNSRTHWCMCCDSRVSWSSALVRCEVDLLYISKKPIFQVPLHLFLIPIATKAQLCKKFMFMIFLCVSKLTFLMAVELF